MMKRTLFQIPSAISFALATVALATFAEAAQPSLGKWAVGTPIVTYYAGPAMTDAVAEQMAAAGFNVVWCAEKDLDLIHKHGLRGMLRDPLIASASIEYPAERMKFDALIERVKNHPALYAYYVIDEPSAEVFAPVAKIVAHLRDRDPAHLAYVNLFPVNAPLELLGIPGEPVAAYREYLKRYIDLFKPQLLSYDHYQFMVDQDLKQYFLNLAMMRQVALDSNTPFLNIVQASAWYPVVRVPNADETRYLVYTTLAYGAQGISYYVYMAPEHRGGIATADGKPTPIYDALKTLNPQFVAIAIELQSLRSLSVYHTAMKEAGCEPLPADAAFRPVTVTTTPTPTTTSPTVATDSPRGLLFGNFGKTDQPTHALIVNLDYGAAATVTLAAPANVEAFDPDTKKWSPVANPTTLQLPPGGGTLVRIPQSRAK